MDRMVISRFYPQERLDGEARHRFVGPDLLHFLFRVSSSGLAIIIIGLDS
jgi:hypothetical protein